MSATIYPWGDDPAGQYDWLTGKITGNAYKGGTKMPVNDNSHLNNAVLNNTDLQEGSTPDTIGDAQGDAQKAAGVEAPEDTASAYLKTIAEQQETIKDLLGQVNSLNNQMASFTRSMGSHVSQEDNPDKAATSAASLPDDYVYLKDLGKEIGKRER